MMVSQKKVFILPFKPDYIIGMYGKYNEIFSLILCSLSYQTRQCLLLCDKDLDPNDRGIADEGEKNQAEDFKYCCRQSDLIIIDILEYIET